MAAAKPFELVAETGSETAAPPATAAQSQQDQASIRMLQIAIAALSKRAVVALASLFTGLGLFSAWWLWQSVLPNPTILQLVGVGMYAVFLLALEFVRRR